MVVARDKARACLSNPVMHPFPLDGDLNLLGHPHLLLLCQRSVNALDRHKVCSSRHGYECADDAPALPCFDGLGVFQFLGEH